MSYKKVCTTETQALNIDAVGCRRGGSGWGGGRTVVIEVAVSRR